LLLQDTFDEHDRSLLAATRICKLRQGSQSVSFYASEFRRLASDLKWNDSALVHQFRSGLNDEGKDMLLHHPYPMTLGDAISLAIGVGNRLFEHRQEMFLTLKKKIPMTMLMRLHQMKSSQKFNKEKHPPMKTLQKPPEGPLHVLHH
jgi:hypothetical protein